MMDGRDPLHCGERVGYPKPPSAIGAEAMEWEPSDDSPSYQYSRPSTEARGEGERISVKSSSSKQVPDSESLEPKGLLERQLRGGNLAPKPLKEILQGEKRPRQSEAKHIFAGIGSDEENDGMQSRQPIEDEPRKKPKTAANQENFTAAGDLQSVIAEKWKERLAMGRFAPKGKIVQSNDLSDMHKNEINSWGTIPINNGLPSAFRAASVAMTSKISVKHCDYTAVWKSLTILDLIAGVAALEKIDKSQALPLKSIKDIAITEENLEMHEALFKISIPNVQFSNYNSVTSQGRSIINEIFQVAASNPEKIYAMTDTPAVNAALRVEKIIEAGLSLPMQVDISPIDSIILQTSGRRFPYFVPYSSTLLWIAEKAMDPLMTAFLYNRSVGASVYPFGQSFFIPYCVKRQDRGKLSVHKAAIFGIRNRGGLPFIPGDWMVTIVGSLPPDIVERLVKQLHLAIVEEFSYRVCTNAKLTYDELGRTYYALVAERVYLGPAEGVSTASICSLLEPSNPVQLQDWAHARSEGTGAVRPLLKTAAGEGSDKPGFSRGHWQPYRFMIGANEDMWLSIMERFLANSQPAKVNPVPIQHYLSRLFYDINFCNSNNCWSLVAFGTRVISLQALCEYLKNHCYAMLGFEPCAIDWMFAVYHEHPRTKQEIDEENAELKRARGRLPPLAEIKYPLINQDWVIVTFQLLDSHRQNAAKWHPSVVQANRRIVDFFTASQLLLRASAAHICATTLCTKDLTPQLASVFTQNFTTDVYCYGLPAQFQTNIAVLKIPSNNLGDIARVALYSANGDIDRVASHLDANDMARLITNKKTIQKFIQLQTITPKKEPLGLPDEPHVPYEALTPSQKTLIAWVQNTYKEPASEEGGRNLFLQGKTGVGKTAFTNWLCNRFVCYIMKESSGYYDGIEPSTQLIIIDSVDYKGKILRDLLNLREGNTFKIKYGSVLVPINPRLVFVSNLSFEEYFMCSEPGG